MDSGHRGPGSATPTARVYVVHCTVCTYTACCVACLARTLAAAWLAVLSWL